MLTESLQVKEKRQDLGLIIQFASTNTCTEKHIVPVRSKPFLCINGTKIYPEVLKNNY